jgi:hypothetical protein
VIGAVAVGAAAAPALVLAAAVAPLLPIVLARPLLPMRHPIALAISLAVAALLLWAHLAALGDAAVLLGARRWQAAVVAAALALLLTVLPRNARGRRLALAIGGGALLVVLVAAGAAIGQAPWTAWRAATARPSLSFTERSPWVTDGERFVRPTTLAFDEGHRVVAVSAGTFRVSEMDGGARVVRDWRLAAGDALSVRPGDTLAIEPGSRVRFEPGKRVPGAPPSGSAWADGATRASPLRALALVATIALGACALVPSPTRHAAAACVVTVALALGGTAWGVYATLIAPEAGLTGSPVEALLALPRVAVNGVPRGALTLLVVLGLFALFVAAADGLREPLAAAGGARWPIWWTAAIAAGAIAAALSNVTPWTPLLAGLGLAGSAVAAPRLAATDRARIGAWPAAAAGGLVGAAVFVAITVFGARLPAPLTIVREAPVLAAAPAAWLLVKVLRRGASTAR